MKKTSASKTLILFVTLIAAVIIFSLISSKMRGGKPEEVPEKQELHYRSDMTVGEYGKSNNVPEKVLKKVFNLQSKEELEKSLSEFGLNEEQLKGKVNKALALYAEQESKNWSKIVIKFILWFVFLGIVFAMLHRSEVKPNLRKWLYLIAVIVFGVGLGADPSPMGTVKDAIVLFGVNKVVFIPRMIALLIFLLLVLIANKFICSWGCQFGVIQDLIFRLNRNEKKNQGIIRQYKPPFVVMNTIRIVFFAVFTVVAFLWAIDVVEFIDPFKIYKPLMLSYIGWIFIALILILSLFVYRPWCHLFCPFGLVGWLVEKISIYKIKVNYDTCIACETCAKACPSTVMNAILKRENVIPDCFSCSTCINVCPSDSIKFDTGKRDKPPEGKYN